jgi:hypothetical protein
MLGELFINADRSKSLKVSGIETKYLCFDVDGFTAPEVIDCKSMYSHDGFTYDASLGALFVRCEAVRNQSNANGDGFNGHSSNTGDIHSKQTTVTFIDCWSHDNQDDGYSDHERSETTIIGGLYEYNGKGGITPSYGSHCTCYNVMSRKNYSGFYYAGSAVAEEGGKGGQLICYDCIAVDNNIENPKSGYAVTGEGNSVILVNCRSIGHDFGYNCTYNSKMTLIDCRSLNDKSVKTGSAYITIRNTELVTE